jgi:tetratricopeptide (TPR) repeat protein
VEQGYASRGTRFSKDVTEEQWAGMGNAFAHAQGDLSRALEIQPDAYPAYGYAIYMLKSAGQPGEIQKWLEALLARDPLNYGVRRRAMQSLDVMWGGSLEQQRAIADEAQRYADGNPRLRILPGYVEAQVGQTAFRSKKYAEAAAAYRRALAHGALHDWYAMLGDALIYTDSWKELLEVSDQWLAELGDYNTPRQYRGRALAELGQIEAARADLEKARAGAPDHAYTLRSLGLAQRRAGMPKEALASYRRALKLEPNEPWTLEQIAALEQAEAQREHSAAAAKARAAAPEPAPRTLPGLSRIPLTPSQS